MVTWRKSSRSTNNGACVEASAAWRTSSHSAELNCVEVATPGAVLVRDSKDPGPVLAFTRAQWSAFTTALKGSP